MFTIKLRGKHQPKAVDGKPHYVQRVVSCVSYTVETHDNHYMIQAEIKPNEYTRYIISNDAFKNWDTAFIENSNGKTVDIYRAIK